MIGELLYFAVGIRLFTRLSSLNQLFEKYTPKTPQMNVAPADALSMLKMKKNLTGQIENDLNIFCETMLEKYHSGVISGKLNFIK